MTYLCNWIAEYRKNNFDWGHNGSPLHLPTLRLKKRAYRKMVLQMEILPPLLSVMTLVIVTIVVSYRAILVLAGPPAPESAQHPNIELMMGFSIFNLGLDMLNVFCFASAKHLLGYSTVEAHGVHDGESRPSTGLSPMGYSRARESSPTTDIENGNTGEQRDGLTTNYTTDDDEDEDEHRTNLNMCSAYTHVFADTLRSLAVILASTISQLAGAVTPEVADSAAALAVSILILLSLIPLFQGLIQSASELRGILAEEKSEAMLQQATRLDREMT
jgi:Co/Zn/Cd efflux system component